MKRIRAAIKLDILTQWRNQLYSIGIGVGGLTALMLAWLAPSDMAPQIIPSILLAIIGGSTLVYIGGMIVFERQQQTLAAVIVSPLRSLEFIGSKIFSLAMLATIESFVIVAGMLLLKSFLEPVALPNIIPIFLGVAFMGIMYTSAGLILAVRCQAITEFLIPMACIAVVGQIPIFYFLDMVSSPFLLAIPTSAPALMIRGGYLELSLWQSVYAVGYSVITIGILVCLAHRAFQAQVIRKAG